MLLKRILITASLAFALCPMRADCQQNDIGTDRQALDELLAEKIHTHDSPSSVPFQVVPGWWQGLIGLSFDPESESIPLSLQDALLQALEHSSQIKVFAELPLIRETAITEASSAFDWNAFIDTQWADRSDPVGNTQTAGAGINRFRDHNLTFSAGLQKRTHTGANLELSQQFGIQENNSQFFVPNNQGTSRLVLGFTQPLMRGRGRTYNQSLLCLAKIDHRIADDEFRRQLQAHLFEVTRAYWALYLERGMYLQKLKSFRRANETVKRLELRQTIDASKNLITSSRATVTMRLAGLHRAKAAVTNAESKLRSLVNAPSLNQGHPVEIIPIDQPTNDLFHVNKQSLLAEAVQYHPEVTQAIKQIKAASIRCKMSVHELKPVLNLITQTYLAGLEGRRDIAGAWNDQFSEGEPGYSIGLRWEMPFRNRAAQARLKRRRLELRQTSNQYATTLQKVDLEVNVAANEINTSLKELVSKQTAMVAQSTKLDSMVERWQKLSTEGPSTALVLEDLLNNQERLLATESEFLKAQIVYNLSLMNIKRVAGTLLQHENVRVDRGCIDGLPINLPTKSEQGSGGHYPSQTFGDTTQPYDAITTNTEETGPHTSDPLNNPTPKVSSPKSSTVSSPSDRDTRTQKRTNSESVYKLKPLNGGMIDQDAQVHLSQPTVTLASEPMFPDTEDSQTFVIPTEPVALD